MVSKTDGDETAFIKEYWPKIVLEDYANFDCDQNLKNGGNPVERFIRKLVEKDGDLLEFNILPKIFESRKV